MPFRRNRLKKRRRATSAFSGIKKRKKTFKKKVRAIARNVVYKEKDLKFLHYMSDAFADGPTNMYGIMNATGIPTSGLHCDLLIMNAGDGQNQFEGKYINLAGFDFQGIIKNGSTAAITTEWDQIRIMVYEIEDIARLRRTNAQQATINTQLFEDAGSYLNHYCNAHLRQGVIKRKFYDRTFILQPKLDSYSDYGQNHRKVHIKIRFNRKKMMADSTTYTNSTWPRTIMFSIWSDSAAAPNPYFLKDCSAKLWFRDT